MTAKDFRLIAACLRTVADVPWADQRTIEYTIQTFAYALAAQNGRVDRDRFEAACKP
jgi:hypothetical protein